MKYLLLHGMGQNASSWDKTLSYLPATIEMVCPELSIFSLMETAITVICIVLFVSIAINSLSH